MNSEFLALLKRRIASTSVGPSTARRMGPKGTIQAAREFLRDIDLCSFRALSARAFGQQLDRTTANMCHSLRRFGLPWGAARKFMNIFLRNAFYNRFLCERYKLARIEPWLEVPLDSHVAKGLSLELGSEDLPRWRSVIGLTKQESDAYQGFALEVARRKRTCRAHLDLLYWRGDHIGRRFAGQRRRSR